MTHRLRELADTYGVATEYWDWKWRHTMVPDSTIVAVLAAMDIDAATPEAVELALAEVPIRRWRRVLPTCVVTESGRTQTVEVHVPAGASVTVSVRFEDGGGRDLVQVDNWEPDRQVDDELIGEASFEIPGDLPLGYHRLVAVVDDKRQVESSLVVSPHFLGFPRSMGDKRVWGYAVQLYSVRSKNSWGVGDLEDLADLATWAGTQHYADYVLVNPLHAGEPMPPIEPSPYLPTSRRYVNPLYIRPEVIPEFATLPEPKRQRVARQWERLQSELADNPRIVRDESWLAKIGALRVIFKQGLSVPRQMAFDAFCRQEGQVLTRFATWCVLVNFYGMDWRAWPVELQRPSSPEVAAFAEENQSAVQLFKWLQWIADNQLRAAQSRAKDAGMRIGIMNDLAVGVSTLSAEAWALGETFAESCSVGAPPDHFNQTGQDWGQLPWRPDRLEALAYAPFRNMVAGVLRHSGGIRVDHIMGLFRLWWIPKGASATEGTYVRYNHEAMVGILALEAYRAGALVVGEDLGVVEPWVRAYLRDRGILGTSIAWFERGEDGQPLPAGDWREYCLASVTTHDLPPTAGYLARDHIRLQHQLGLLTESLEEELSFAQREQNAWLAILRDSGLLAADANDVEDIVLAMHRYIAATPARVRCAALTDAVGDRLTQNQPGTIDEYPNWRVPLSHPSGEPMWLEEVYPDARARRLAAVMNEWDQ